ncbi:MAG: DUF7507 domain-containing protein [Thermoanaerobaculia bacterium]
MKYSIRVLALVALLAVAAMPMAAEVWPSTSGHYTATFLGVNYNQDGTSTWNYMLVWDGVPPGLSHFGVEFCGTARVVSYSPTAGVEVGPDPSLQCDEGAGFWGIKWNVGAMTYPAFFSFTLDQWYAVGDVRFAAKAGQDCNVGTIYGPTCLIADPKIDVEKSCTADVFVGDSIDYGIIVTNSGNVPLFGVVVDDATAGVHETYSKLEPGESHTINVSVPATAEGSVTNTVTATGSYFNFQVSDTASCATAIWDIDVSKLASTSYTRDYDWTIEKTADPLEGYPLDETTGLPLIDFCAGAELPLDFEIALDRSYVDSNWMVTGTISISNPAPIAANLASVVDVVSGGFDATVVCPSFVVPAGGTLLCTYEAPLSDATDRLNTATATLINGHSVSGTADVLFGNPTTVIDGTVTVTDLVTCPVGFTCTPAGPFTFAAAATQQYSTIITNVDAMCGSWYDISNLATIVETGASDGSAAVIKTCACGHGCTLTIGYWKTHAGFTGRNADVVTQYLPITLGTAGSAKSLVVTTAQQAVDVLTMKTYGEPSNGITKLYAQLPAAKLNIANGSSWDDIDKELAKADAFLAIYDWTDWASLSNKQKKDVISWMSAFDAYNNGLIGPGHCD